MKIQSVRENHFRSYYRVFERAKKKNITATFYIFSRAVSFFIVNIVKFSRMGVCLFFGAENKFSL